MQTSFFSLIILIALLIVLILVAITINNNIINNKYLLFTKQQKPTLSYSNPTLDCDSVNKLEDNYIFDVIAIDNNKDT